MLIAVAVVIGLAAGGVGQAQAASITPTKSQGSQVEARATFLPLAALVVCTRLCPVAGVAAARAFSTQAGSSASRALGNAMSKTAEDAAAMRAAGFHAHHIVAVNHPRAEFARIVLASRAIQPNGAANGVWLRRSVHGPVHTNGYYANVNAVVRSTGSTTSARRLSWSTT